MDDRWNAARDFQIDLCISLVGIAVVSYLFYQATGVIRNAVEVTGTVVGFSLLRAQGKTPITYEYTYEGRKYNHRVDVKKSEADEYRSNPAIALLVNSHRPSQSMRVADLKLSSDSVGARFTRWSLGSSESTAD